ncbi:abortive infection system antitoxin AbiGi family protein [Mucilaginibacter aquariorum]|uniref:Abortive infection system antitoxin AbiGi family protein n=1 Tax=Mucilaginibacter aquariorum TaxID=2967225 RepID=A0ABT1SX22_9SPHI|nr:abortive infection system antitoxin AbiGi family protein [Mucilaginibacter aquariorum]MCQ6956896.1 abortive infection system antitoxin AbiGi family protein [Mucilaginibacter aquariorum]
MSLSSNSLIHLTNTKQALKGILTENFKIKYCVENVLTQTGKLSYAVPMVSFCDIPMSEIKEHIEKYGSYGIGLTREWGQANSLNPVFYVDKNSSIGKAYYETFDEIFLGPKRKVSELTDIESKHLDVMRYMKNYEADLNRNGKIEHNYRYADEKEWRYVPNKNEAPMVYRNEIYVSNKAKFNNKLNELRLYFEPKDIKYIIIQHDHEITEFINMLRDSKGTKYSYNDVERLMTRIITVEQIKSDF